MEDVKSIKLEQGNIFYKINNISYARDDNLYDLSIFLLSKNNRRFNLDDVIRIQMTLIKPDGFEVIRQLIVEEEDILLARLKVRFNKSDFLKLGIYELSISVFKIDEEIKFQKFMFTLCQHKGLIKEAGEEICKIDDVIAISEDEPINNAQIWVKPVLNK